MPTLRRALIVLSVLMLAGLGHPVPRPARAFEMTSCEYCHRAWDDSPSRIKMYVDAHNHEKVINVCSPYCLAEVLKLHDYYKLISVQMVPWQDRAEIDTPLLAADGPTAKFLIGVKDEKDRSHDPDVAAFRNDQLLAEGKKALGGETITWDKLLAKCKKLAAAHEEDDGDSYVPIKTGREH